MPLFFKDEVMPTPNTYDLNNFKKILSQSVNVYHQTSIKNLANIIAEGAIYSAGTLWGKNPSVANAYFSSGRRRSNLKNTADNGFVDYIFCSFNNGLSHKFNRYGYVSFELSEDIIFNKECFIYPFNFVFGIASAPNTDMFSDLSTWNSIVSKIPLRPSHEILVRRKINLDTHIVKIHCFSSVHNRVVEILKDTRYSAIPIESHPDPVGNGGFMATEYIADIEGEKFTAILSEDGKHVSIYDVISDEDGDFLGEFSLDKDRNIIQHYGMSGTSKVVGKLLLKSGENQTKLASAN